MLMSAYDGQFQFETDPVPTDRSMIAPLGLLIVNVKVSVGPGLVIGRIGTWMCALVLPGWMVAVPETGL